MSYASKNINSFFFLLHLRPIHTEVLCCVQGQTDHLETRALPEGPGSVGGPMRCPWYLFHRLF
ncbi:unnamed protein product [Staurois parvus]|uniref:Secreted protein n=1 Tax=Staurois parvus TaxID=386267 RepID=A0ABN9D7S6_9NEOB|nr:unnamed protein product [Staurois parvus]